MLRLVIADLFHSVHKLAFADTAIIYILLTLFGVGGLTYATLGTARSAKMRIANRGRDDVIRAQLTEKYQGKSKAERRELIDQELPEKLESVCAAESSAFAVFYNNALFLVAALLCATWLFKSFSVTFNYIWTIVASALTVVLVASAK